MNIPVFRRALISWYSASRRDLPWRKSKDFYRVWLSEIMLQQTRVAAVIPYYQRFLDRFPTVEALADAPEQDVLANWSGLGYYSRARNLHKAAKRIAEAIPQTHEQIADLPGVGPYTSAAIASIALGLPHAAVDGNVMRVVSRLTNDPSEISAPATRARFAFTAQQLLDRKRPGDFNQAMMELGATICTPRSPDCPRCPVRKFCQAFAAGTQNGLPVKLKKSAATARTLEIALLSKKGCVFLVRRDMAASRMAGFWELPEKTLFPKCALTLSNSFAHQIVNDRFQVSVWTGRVPARLPEGQWVPVENLRSIPLTTVSRKAIDFQASLSARQQG